MNFSFRLSIKLTSLSYPDFYIIATGNTKNSFSRYVGLPPPWIAPSRNFLDDNLRHELRTLNGTLVDTGHKN